MASIEITTTATVPNGKVEAILKEAEYTRRREKDGFSEITLTKSGILAAWEHGGALTSAGKATLWADEYGRPLPLIYERRSGELACKHHALVAVSVGSLRVHANTFTGKVSVTRVSFVRVTHDGQTPIVEAKMEDVWRSLPDEEPPAWLRDAVRAARRKASIYHCRRAVFVDRHKRGGLRPVISRTQIEAAAAATRAWPTSAAGIAAAERDAASAERERKRVARLLEEREREQREEAAAREALRRELEAGYTHARVGDVAVAVFLETRFGQWGKLRLPWGEEVVLGRSEAPDYRFDEALIEAGEAVPLKLEGVGVSGPIWGRRAVMPEEREEALKGWVPPAPPAPSAPPAPEDLPGEILEVEGVYKTSSRRTEVRWKTPGGDGVFKCHDIEEIEDLYDCDRVRVKIRVWDGEWGPESEFVSLA